MTWIQAVVLAIVEGITEFLPISSTGHMIIASSLMGISDDDFTKLFEVCIQFGAILSVVVLYWRKFFDFKRLSFYVKLLVAFIPAAIFGLLFSEAIDAMLESALTVGITLLLGGVFMLFMDRLFKNPVIDKEEDISFKKAFFIGCFQVIAMIPGVSRSGATIVGGLQQKLTRKVAAEFSFFLAVPTMMAATVKKTYDYYKDGMVLNTEQINLLLLGNVVAFIVAMIAIKTFIHYVQKHSFKEFGIYRIIAGIAIIFMIQSGTLKDNNKVLAPAPEPVATHMPAKVQQPLQR